MNGTITKHRQILLLNTKEEANRAPAPSLGTVALTLFTVRSPSSRPGHFHWGSTVQLKLTVEVEGRIELDN